MHSPSAESSFTRFEIPVATLVVDERGHVIDANDSWCEQTGLTVESSLFDGWKNAFAEHDAERLSHEWSRAIAAGSPLEIEISFRDHDSHGRPRFALLHLRPQDSDLANSSGISFLATVSDISRIKRENALQKGQSRLLQIIAAGAELEKTLTVLALLIEDTLPRTRCSILLVNDRETHLRYGAAPSLPESYVQATSHVPIAPDAGCCGRAACVGERVISEDIEIDPLWKSYCHLAKPHGFRACWSQPLFDYGDRVLGTFAMYYGEARSPNEEEIRVIELAGRLAEIAIKTSRAGTQLRAERNAAKLANQRKTSFLARVSHDMRTPMNTVLGMVDLALSGDLSSEHREYLTTARRSGLAILELLNDVIDLAKIEAGKMRLEASEIRIEEFVLESLGGLAYTAQQKGLEVVIDVHESVPEVVEGDPARLRQILVNLAGNAIKFTEQGEICITVRTKSLYGGDSVLEVSVEDTGIGIPKELHAHIFDSFVQAEDGTAKHFGGSGLGLAISARLVRIMGGRIWLKSEVGKGSTFSFEVALKKLSDAPAIPRLETTNGRVLLVCANEYLRSSISRRLQHWSLTPTSVVGVDACLAELESAARRGEPYEILLLDRDVDAPIKIRRLVTEAQSHAGFGTHVVILESTLARANAGSIDDARGEARIAKPVSTAELERALRTVLSGDPTDAPEHPAPRARPDSGSAFETELRKSLKILLVDDNEDNRALAARVLKKRGHRVICARNGREAMERLELQTFDVALMDLHMPVLDGLDATRAIRAAESESGEHLPIVAMTANAMRAQEAECLQAGMDGYISKPFNFADLFRIVESLGEG